MNPLELMDDPDPLIRQWYKDGLRAAIMEDTTGDEAYRELMRFDMRTCLEYDGFKAACDAVGLPYITIKKWKKMIDEVSKG